MADIRPLYTGFKREIEALRLKFLKQSSDIEQSTVLGYFLQHFNISTIRKLIFQTQMAAYFRPYKTKKTCTFIHYS